MTYQSRFGGALILLARQETRSYLKDPIDYFIFAGGKLLARDKRCSLPGDTRPQPCTRSRGLHRRRAVRAQGRRDARARRAHRRPCQGDSGGRQGRSARRCPAPCHQVLAVCAPNTHKVAAHLSLKRAGKRIQSGFPVAVSVFHTHTRTHTRLRGTLRCAPLKGSAAHNGPVSA